MILLNGRADSGIKWSSAAPNLYVCVYVLYVFSLKQPIILPHTITMAANDIIFKRCKHKRTGCDYTQIFMWKDSSCN